MTAQPWCGGTFSRNQSSRSSLRPEGSSSHSSLVVSGRESPKTLLTEGRLWRESSVTALFQCDEHHTWVQVAVHVAATQSSEARPGSRLTPTAPLSLARGDRRAPKT